MSSQIYNILEVLEEIKSLIKDSQYKTTLDNLIQNYNNNNNNVVPNATPTTLTTARDIEIKRLTDEILTNVKLRVEEIKQLIIQ
jgi:hypothetical protein